MNDGGISIIDRVLEELLLNEVETDSLGIGGAYKLTLPAVTPTLAGLSLVVGQISNGDATLEWDLSSSSSTGVSSGLNAILFRAPDSLASSYTLSLPDYDGASDIEDQVLIVTGDDGAGKITLGFQNLRFGSTPTMTASTSLKQITLTSNATAANDIILRLPAITHAETVGDLLQTVQNLASFKVIASSASDSDMSLEWTIPADVSTPSVSNSTSRITFGCERANGDLIYRMPSYDASNYTSEALQVISMTVNPDTIEFGFTRDFTNLESLYIDNVKLATPDDSATEHGHELHLHIPTAIAATISARNKVLGISAYTRISGQPHVYLSYVDPMNLRNHVHTQTCRLTTPSTLARSYELSISGLFSGNNMQKSTLNIITDNLANTEPELKLNYRRHPTIANHDDLSKPAKVTLIHTANNALNGNLVLPPFDPAVDTTNQCLRVSANTTNSVTLAFEPKNVIYFSNGDAVVTVETPDAQAINCEIRLPSFISSLSATYISRVLKVKESTGSSVDLEWGRVFAFSNLSEITLLDDATAKSITLQPLASANTSLAITLPPAYASSKIGHTLSNSLTQSMATGTSQLAWRSPGDLPSTAYEVFTRVLAQPGMSADNVVRLPAAGSAGKCLRLDSFLADGSAQLALADASSLVLSSSGSANTCAIGVPALASSSNLVLPAYSDGVKGGYVGSSLRVVSHATGEATLGYVYAGRLFASGASGTYIDLTHNRASASSAELHMPSMNTPSVTGNYVTVESIDASTNEVHLEYVKHPPPHAEGTHARVSLRTSTLTIPTQTLSLPSEPVHGREFLYTSTSGTRTALKSQQNLQLSELVLGLDSLLNANAARGHAQELALPLFEELDEQTIVSSVRTHTLGSTVTKRVSLNERRSARNVVGSTERVIGTRALISLSNLPSVYAVQFAQDNVSGCDTIVRSGSSFECAVAGLYQISVELNMRVASGSTMTPTNPGNEIMILLQDANVTWAVYEIDQTRPGRHYMRDCELFSFHDGTVPIGERPIYRKRVEFTCELNSGALFYLFADHDNSSDSGRSVSISDAAITFSLLA